MLSLFFFRLKFRKLLAKSFLAWLGFLSCLEASTLKLCFVSSLSLSFLSAEVSRLLCVWERERERELQSFFFRTRLSCLLQSVRHSELGFYFFFVFLQVFGELAGSVIRVCCSTATVFWDLITVRFRECCCRCCYFCFACYLCLRCFSLWSAIVCFPHSFIRYSAKFQALWISLI